MQKHATLSFSLLLTLGATTVAQTSFDHDRFLTPGLAPPGILTEAFPGVPVVAIPMAAMGLLPNDEIDALSYGDDQDIGALHTIVFSPDLMTMGMPGTGVAFEFAIDTAPGGPPSASGDIFVQDPTAAAGNLLAPPGQGYAAGTGTGDENNASWPSPCVAGGCIDLDAFDYGDPMLATGVYFSLRPGSPTLGFIGAGPGAILYSDLMGGVPIVATLAGAGPATAANLGIPNLNLDALNCLGSTGPIGAGGGVIAPGIVGPSIAGLAPPPSTHLLQYSVSFTGAIDGDVLVRVGAGVFAPHTPAPVLGLAPNENLNALEVLRPGCPPAAATVFSYNGIGINLDTMVTSTVVIGGAWTATLIPQAVRAGGPWVILMRANNAGLVLDAGLAFFGVPAGFSELLVGGGFIANFFPAPHLGGGIPASFSAAVPPACALVGMPWFAQSLVFGDLPLGAGLLDPWFSSAAGGVVGTF
ncbi:MAG: hypothetical protein CMJ89_04115 [Planctomycetes bacterium]|jgi:hypothetical protein|nr:hypothetical protein [Planctomycetota bacterium]